MFPVFSAACDGHVIHLCQHNIIRYPLPGLPFPALDADVMLEVPQEDCDHEAKNEPT